MTERPGDATEWEAEIGPGPDGGYEWRLQTVNGKWPHSIAHVRLDDMKTNGRTFTKRGARKEAQRAIKNIKHLQTTKTETIS